MKSHTITIENKNELTLKLTIEDYDIIYHVRTDKRVTDILEIENFINSELTTYSVKKPFTVSEYLVITYIYIGNIDLREQRQFTASKSQ